MVVNKLILSAGDRELRHIVEGALDREKRITEMALVRTCDRLRSFEKRFGGLEEARLSGVDELEIVEWEGELLTYQRLKERLARLESLQLEIA